jgi:hypothetical protein
MRPMIGKSLLPERLNFCSKSMFLSCMNMITFRFFRNKTEWIFIMPVAKIYMRSGKRALNVRKLPTLNVLTLSFGRHPLCFYLLIGYVPYSLKEELFLRISVNHRD